MARSNCILFACALSWRRWRKLRRDRKRNPGLKRPRAYFVIRWSDWGWFPHVLYGREVRRGRVRAVSFKPLVPKKRNFPPLLFKGKVEWGD
jgi:hypothetical protein